MIAFEWENKKNDERDFYGTRKTCWQIRQSADVDNGCESTQRCA